MTGAIPEPDVALDPLFDVAEEEPEWPDKTRNPITTITITMPMIIFGVSVIPAILNGGFGTGGEGWTGGGGAEDTGGGGGGDDGGGEGGGPLVGLVLNDAPHESQNVCPGSIGLPHWGHKAIVSFLILYQFDKVTCFLN